MKFAMLLLSLVSCLFTYGILRLQESLKIQVNGSALRFGGLRLKKNLADASSYAVQI